MAEYKIHIESQMEPWMSWRNYGSWHIDHIIQIAMYKGTWDLHKVMNYRNLRPLSAKQNDERPKKKIELELVKQHDIFDLLPEKSQD